jgi:hypothetical protein
MNYGKLTAGTTKTAIDTAKPSEKGEIITYLSRMGDVLEQILERHQLVAVFILGVNIVVDSDVAHIIGREYLLDIKTGVQLVSSKAGKILCDDDGDVAVAHVIHHLFKGWAIEIRAGIAIVHIKSGVLEPILIGVLLQDKFLVLDTVGVALQIIISGQTAIERRDLLVWL